jgi:acyl carrier protein
MTPASTFETIRDLLRDICDDPDLGIAPATNPTALPGWDSLTQVTLAVALQNTFRIRFTLPELFDLGTVEALVRLIDRKLERGDSPRQGAEW